MTTASVMSSIKAMLAVSPTGYTEIDFGILFGYRPDGIGVTRMDFVRKPSTDIANLLLRLEAFVQDAVNVTNDRARQSVQGTDAPVPDLWYHFDFTVKMPAGPAVERNQHAVGHAV